jgi:hypothetical protein
VAAMSSVGGVKRSSCPIKTYGGGGCILDFGTNWGEWSASRHSCSYLQRGDRLNLQTRQSDVSGLQVIASYQRNLDKRDCLSEGQHRFRPGYSCESPAIMVCQDSADSLDNGGRIHVIIIDSVSHELLWPLEWTRGQLRG